MASPILPSLGLGSGLNTTAIVEALVNAEKTPSKASSTAVPRPTPRRFRPSVASRVR